MRSHKLIAMYCRRRPLVDGGPGNDWQVPDRLQLRRHLHLRRGADAHRGSVTGTAILLILDDNPELCAHV